jgi:hypothetical protein
MGDLKRNDVEKSLWDSIKNGMALGTQLGATLFSELISLIGNAQLVGTPSAFTVAALKIGLEFHDAISQERLRALIDTLRAEMGKIREKGALIDMTDQRNQWRFVDAMEDYLRARSDNKLDLLRRIALNGLIKTDVSDEKQRNYRFVVGVLEMEDLDVLMAMTDLSEGGPRPRINADRSVPTFVDPGEIQRGELPSATGYSIGRLLHTGLVEYQSTADGLILRITREGIDFLRYLKDIGGSG